MITEIDVSCDIGEGYGPYRIADDKALLRLVSSANVACGFHAGDPSIMLETIVTAHALGVTVGGHFGKPDLHGFGRREMELTSDEIFSGVLYQCGALELMARTLDRPMRYVSFHGNMGATIGRDPHLADRLAAAWRAMSPAPQVQGMPGSPLLSVAERHGLATIPVLLSDRGYRSDGSLVPRGAPGALVQDVGMLKARIAQFVTTGMIDSVEGTPVAMSAKSIVVHSDTPGAVDVATAIRDELARLNVAVRFPDDGVD